MRGAGGGGIPPDHPPSLSGSGGLGQLGKGGGGSGARRKGRGPGGRSASPGGCGRAPPPERERGSGDAGNRIVQPVTFPPAAAPPALPPPPPPVQLARVQPTAPGGAGGRLVLVRVRQPFHSLSPRGPGVSPQIAGGTGGALGAASPSLHPGAAGRPEPTSAEKVSGDPPPTSSPS